MAAASATTKYASRTSYAGRGAVSGSSALDLDRSRGYKSAAAPSARPSGQYASKSQATVGYVTLPRPGYSAAAAAPARTAKTAAQAQAAPARTSRPAEKQAPAEERAVRPSVKTAPRAQKAYGLSLFAVAGFVFVAVLMVFVLLAHVKYNEISSETVKLQAQLDTLNEEERKLKIAYEDAFDVNEVEEYATNVLGMTKPTDTQVGTVDTGAADKAEIIGKPADSTTGQSDLATFLMSLVAYFK